MSSISSDFCYEYNYKDFEIIIGLYSFLKCTSIHFMHCETLDSQ